MLSDTAHLRALTGRPAESPPNCVVVAEAEPGVVSYAGNASCSPTPLRTFHGLCPRPASRARKISFAPVRGGGASPGMPYVGHQTGRAPPPPPDNVVPGYSSTRPVTRPAAEVSRFFVIPASGAPKSQACPNQGPGPTGTALARLARLGQLLPPPAWRKPASLVGPEWLTPAGPTKNGGAQSPREVLHVQVASIQQPRLRWRRNLTYLAGRRAASRLNPQTRRRFASPSREPCRWVPSRRAIVPKPPTQFHQLLPTKVTSMHEAVTRQTASLGGQSSLTSNFPECRRIQRPKRGPAAEARRDPGSGSLKLHRSWPSRCLTKQHQR